MEDLAGTQDDRAKDDLKAGQECSRQAAPTCHREVEQDLLGYRGVLQTRTAVTTYSRIWRKWRLGAASQYLILRTVA